MREQFVIEGNHRLQGEVTVSGNKNAALKMLPACLLTDEPIILTNMPDIADVRVTYDLMRSLGADIEMLSDHRVRVHARDVTTSTLPPSLCLQTRASVVFAGPVLARTGALEMPPPGGDVIGRRRLDTHILALRKLGAEIDFDGTFHMRAPTLHGADILLDEASVTATENALMAAVRAKGTTRLRNVASEPHVQDLCNMLNGMGAQIEGIGTNCLVIQGVERLHGGKFRVGADYLEVVSFIGAAVVTDSEIRIREADPHYLDMAALVFRRLGVEWQAEGNDILVPRGQSLVIERDLGNQIPEIKAQPWPAFPSDLMSIALTVATQSAGTVLFHEWMYNSRFYFTDKLTQMGARIILCDPHRAVVHGPTVLRGVPDISSPDIRAGMSLIIAALCARGTTAIRNIGQIDRGYERVEEKLHALGANIRREPVLVTA
ncbi:MAG TPA: UDP-N-acetylglucosamine 1-carboxyvinyltransferase [Aggregatilinea sp.]|uniref:UDP-N-acetylglucosamine 1-carboxyvinyltransferase n=1 Tax=Aggregatilinea sp. TaxID=2806333 RepID=UPI002C127D3F|nr:UDP-N-acetylglucosamine 1-carboxyvinyltransferase [Aggregatilinea sp.]HML22819.1 UDP-N-acetylglucosamine 1-carboxyvinyltransferase [Aggregatilinea sp.]